MSDLTTLANLEPWLELSPGNADQAILSRLISAVSAAAETWCGRSFASASYTEIRDGKGGSRMNFANTPVTAFSSVTVDGVTIPASPGAPQHGYLWDAKTITLIGWRFCRGMSNVILSYTAGFSTTPLDLEQAIIEWVAHAYKEKNRIGFVSENVGGQSTMFLVKDMPPRVATILEGYRKRVPV